MEEFQKGLRPLPACFPPNGLTALYKDFAGTHSLLESRFNTHHQMFLSIALLPSSRLALCVHCKTGLVVLKLSWGCLTARPESSRKFSEFTTTRLRTLRSSEGETRSRSSSSTTREVVKTRLARSRRSIAANNGARPALVLSESSACRREPEKNCREPRRASLSKRDITPRRWGWAKPMLRNNACATCVAWNFFPCSSDSVKSAFLRVKKVRRGSSKEGSCNSRSTAPSCLLASLASFLPNFSGEGLEMRRPYRPTGFFNAPSKEILSNGIRITPCRTPARRASRAGRLAPTR